MALLAFSQNGNLQFIGANHGSITTGTANFSDTTDAPFTTTSSTIPWTIDVIGAGASGGVLSTTVKTFTSASAVVLNANAGTTDTTANYAIGCTFHGSWSAAVYSLIPQSVIRGGDLLVLGINVDPTVTISSITDSAGNTWAHTPPSGTNGISNADYFEQIWWCLDAAAAAAGSLTITVTFSATPNPNVTAFYFTSFTASVKGSWSVNAFNSNSSTGTAISSGTVTTTIPNAVMWAMTGVNAATTAVGSGFTQANPNMATGGNLGDLASDVNAYKILTATVSSSGFTATQSAAQIFMSSLVVFGFTPLIVTTPPTLTPPQVDLPPQPQVIAGVLPSNPVPASVVVTGGSPQRTTAFGVVTAAALPPSAQLPIPTIIFGSGSGTGVLDQVSQGFGQAAQPPAVIESMLAMMGIPLKAELPPLDSVLNGKGTGVIDPTSTGFGQAAEAPFVIAAMLAVLGVPRTFDLPPLPELAPGVAPPVPPTATPVLSGAPADLAKMPPFGSVIAGFGQAAEAPVVVGVGQPGVGAPNTMQDGPAFSADLPPAAFLRAGAGQASQPATLVVGQPPPQAALPPLDSVFAGAGQAAQPAQLLVGQPAPPAAPLPPQPVLEAGSGQAAQPPVVLESPLASVGAPFAALLPPPQRVVAGFGQAAQVAQLIVAAAFPPSAQLPPQGALAAGANVVIVPSGSTLYGLPPAPAQLPPAPRMVVGFGQAAQQAILVQSSALPAPPMPSPELVVGFGQPSQAAQLLMGAPPPLLVTLPPPQVVLAGFGQASQPAQLLVGLPPPPVAALPPPQTVLAGFGQPAQVAQLLVGLPPPSQVVLPPAPSLYAGASQPVRAAQLVQVLLPPAAGLPPLALVEQGFGQPPQVAVVLRATFAFDTPPPFLFPALILGFGGQPVPLPVVAVMPPTSVSSRYLPTTKSAQLGPSTLTTQYNPTTVTNKPGNGSGNG